MATDRPGEFTLAFDYALSPADVARVRQVAASVWETAYRLGWQDGVDALTNTVFEAATDQLAAAIREVAAGGPAAAALLVPRTKTVVRNDKGQITAITDAIA